VQNPEWKLWNWKKLFRTQQMWPLYIVAPTLSWVSSKIITRIGKFGYSLRSRQTHNIINLVVISLYILADVFDTISQSTLLHRLQTELGLSSHLHCTRLGVIFTVRRSALHGLWDRNSVRLSVRLSVTLVDCVHTV